MAVAVLDVLDGGDTWEKGGQLGDYDEEKRLNEIYLNKNSLYSRTEHWYSNSTIWSEVEVGLRLHSPFTRMFFNRGFSPFQN